MKCLWSPILLSALLVIGVCRATTAQDDLTAYNLPPRREDLETLPLAGIVEMNYGNISSILTSVFEVMQSITAFKYELVR